MILFARVGLLLALITGNVLATPVVIPLSQMFGGATYTKTFKVEAVHPLITDGTNFYVGTFQNVTPTGGTNPIINLTPNDYVVSFTDSRLVLRFPVYLTNGILNALTQTTNISSYSYQPVMIGGGAATSLSGAAVPQVKSLILNTSGSAYAATNNTFVLVRTNGDDGTGTVGNTNYPFASITNAVGSRTNLYVDIGPGIFAVTNLNIGIGVSLVGSGTNQTFLTIDASASQNSGLSIAGNNVLLKDFSIGTNVNAGLYYFPIRVNAGVTNLLAVNVNVFGNSDCIFAPNVNAKTVGDFYYCNFSSGFDCVQLSSALNGASTNSLFSFYGCSFQSIGDTNFGVIGVSCISASGAQILAKDCSFTASNTLADAYGVIGYYTISGITVENNSYNVAGVTGFPVSATGSLWIRGTFDKTQFSGNANRSWNDFLLPNGALRRKPLY